MAANKHLHKVWQSFLTSSGLEPHLLSRLSVHSPSPGLITFSLPIEAHHLNRLGTVHGGTISTLVDVGGSLAVASKGLFATGVSTDLSVSFLKGGGTVGEVCGFHLRSYAIYRGIEVLTVLCSPMQDKAR